MSTVLRTGCFATCRLFMPPNPAPRRGFGGGTTFRIFGGLDGTFVDRPR